MKTPTEFISLTLPSSEVNALEARAKEMGLTRSAMVRRLIREELSKVAPSQLNQEASSL